MILLCILCFVSCATIAVCLPKEYSFPLLMPGVQPRHNETYLCTGFRMPEEHQYIVGFEPNATMVTAHHILIYGCQQPGYHERDTPRAVWDCGEMAERQVSPPTSTYDDVGTEVVYVHFWGAEFFAETDSAFMKGPTCRGGSHIIYAWAKDAPALALPKNVGFKVGGKTGINYIVLQVHYGNINALRGGKHDNSGIILRMLPGDTNYVTRRAGVYLLGTAGSVPKGRTTHMETACEIDENLVMYPFAFRTHTHGLGTVVSGWRVRDGRWTLVGRRSPQLPQMFYPVGQSIKVQKGDIMAARCTMINNRDHDVYIGNTNNDEMCNFYMMYYVDGDAARRDDVCFSPGYPLYSWKDDALFAGTGGVPDEVDREASILPQKSSE